MLHNDNYYILPQKTQKSKIIENEIVLHKQDLNLKKKLSTEFAQHPISKGNCQQENVFDLFYGFQNNIFLPNFFFKISLITTLKNELTTYQYRIELTGFSIHT